MTFNLKLLIIGFATVLFPACIKKHEIKKIKVLTSETAHQQYVKEDVTIFGKTLTNKQTARYFGKNTLYSAQGKKLIPIQITIYNASNRLFTLMPKSFSLNVINSFELLESNTHSFYISGLLGLGSGLLIIAPLVILFIPVVAIPMIFITGAISTIVPSVGTALGIAIGGTMLFLPFVAPFFIPTYMCGSFIKSTHAKNTELQVGLDLNLMPFGTIMPHNIMNGVIFVSQQEFKEQSLSLTLHEANGNDLSFPFVLC